ncbi:MAG: hypothetical protein N2746_10130 [Deltaproteobacteria bacterium]|nr:hypothetical protein [Deltaproteobacteria bacterium]
MNPSILDKVEQILQYRIDEISYKISLSRDTLNRMYKKVIELSNARFTAENDIKVDLSARWLSDYKNSLNHELFSYMHRFAEQKTLISKLVAARVIEDVRQKAVNKLSNKLRNQQRLLEIIKEEEDVEELCNAKQNY